MKDKRITEVCIQCSKEYQIASCTKYYRKTRNQPNLCKECSKALNNQKQKDRWKNKTAEERELHSRHVKEAMNKMDPKNKELANIRKSIALRKYHKNLSEEDKATRNAKLLECVLKYHSMCTEEEKNEVALKHSDWWNSLTDDEKEAINQKKRDTYNSKTPEERKIINKRKSESMAKWHSNRAPWEKALTNEKISIAKTTYYANKRK